ncbi:MAG: hypothetical protein RR330_01990 [Alistipes sp.]
MKKLLFLLSILLLFCSCTMIKVTLGPGNMTHRTLKDVLKFTDSTGREVILLPMCHVGKQKDYDEIRTYLDQLKADGYVTFFEGLADISYPIDTISEYSYADLMNIKTLHPLTYHTDSLRADTLMRKTRRIMGESIELANMPKNKFVAQSPEILGLTTAQDIWVDYTLYDLIERYERKFGVVPLSDYDFATPMDDPSYSILQAAKGKTDRYTFSRIFRDEALIRRILSSPHKKIAVVYGMGHTAINLKLDFRYLYHWTLDKKYKAK